MRDFIAHNAKFVLEWGQLILVLAIIIGLGIIYMLGRKNKYHLPRGIFGWLSAVLSLFFIVLSVLAFVGITIEKPRTGVILQQFEELKEGKAPNLSFKLVSDDTEHDISEYFGNVILVNIWATWCPPCLKEMPDLNRLQKVYADEGLTVIALSDESRETVLDYAKQYPFDFVSGYVDVFEWVSGDLGSARPVTFLIDKKGIIQEYFTGAYNYDFFESKVTPFLYE